MNETGAFCQLASEGKANGILFRFFGNSSAFLYNFFENSFMFRPYHSETTYEYDFEGNCINTYKTETLYKGIKPLPWYEDIPITITKVAETFYDCWSLKDHGIKTAKHPHKRSIKCTGFKNEDMFPIFSNFNNDTNNFSEIQEWTCGQLVLTRFSKDRHVIFVISKNNEIISICHNDKYDFVDGDSGTHVYILNNKNIFIYNNGDSPSLMLITNCSNITLTPISANIIVNAQKIGALWTDFRQSIINLLYGIINEKKYGIWEYGLFVPNDGNLFHIKERNKGELVCTVLLENDHLLFYDCINDFDFDLNLKNINYELIAELLNNVRSITKKNENLLPDDENVTNTNGK